MWTVATYAPNALFSLKIAVATSSGGKTLLCPTPLSIKLALLDALIRTQGRTSGELWWRELATLRLRIALPAQIAVINTFTKIVRPKKNGPSDDNGTGLLAPFVRTIAYREYVSFGGTFQLAAQTAQRKPLPAELSALFAQLTSLGKRGGFIQLQAPPVPLADEHMPEAAGWVTLTETQQRFSFGGTLQMLDDCAATMTFAHADIYSDKRITLGKERILRHIVLPYTVTRSSRGFTLYERNGA